MTPAELEPVYTEEKMVALAEQYGDHLADWVEQALEWAQKIANEIAKVFMERIKERTGQDPIEIFQKAMTNSTPLLEVKARRIGGSTYQVPIEVKADRGFALSSSWLIESAKKRGGKSFIEKLTNEIIDASNGQGAACKKREDTHKMAEANKACAHYRY